MSLTWFFCKFYFGRKKGFACEKKLNLKGKDIKDWEIKTGILKILHVVSIELKTRILRVIL